VWFATFLVPASVGAFESANAAAFEALGLGAGAGLAFSFVRRGRQLVWIGIGLLVLVSMGWLAKRPELHALDWTPEAVVAQGRKVKTNDRPGASVRVHGGPR
jgi:hypothetical protein